mgnify:CR=1 FL=1
MCSAQGTTEAAGYTIDFFEQRGTSSALESQAYRGFRVNRKLAQKSAYRDYAATLNRFQEERLSSAVDADRNQKAYWNALAGARVAAAAQGQAGQTVNDVSEALAVQSEGYESVRRTNLSWTGEQLKRQLEAIKDNMQGSIWRGLPGPISRPSAWALAVNILGSFAKDADAKIKESQKGDD